MSDWERGIWESETDEANGRLGIWLSLISGTETDEKPLRMALQFVREAYMAGWADSARWRDEAIRRGEVVIDPPHDVAGVAKEETRR